MFGYTEQIFIPIKPLIINDNTNPINNPSFIQISHTVEFLDQKPDKTIMNTPKSEAQIFEESKLTNIKLDKYRGKVKYLRCLCTKYFF